MADKLLELASEVLEELEVGVRIELSGIDGVNAGHLLDAISIVEDAAFDQEIGLLDGLIQKLKPDLEDGMEANLRDQFWAHRGKSLKIEHVADGSVEIWGSLTLLAVWFLQQTVGETIKEAWLKTKLHKWLKQKLGGKPVSKAEQFKVKVEQRFQSAAIRSRYRTSVSLERGEESLIVRVTMEEREGKAAPPTPGKLLVRSGRRVVKTKDKESDPVDDLRKTIYREENPPKWRSPGNRRNPGWEKGEDLGDYEGGKPVVGR